jgi:hypothetical protein
MVRKWKKVKMEKMEKFLVTFWEFCNDEASAERCDDARRS